MNKAQIKEILKKKQLFSIQEFLEGDTKFFQLLNLKCRICEAHLGFMVHFKSDHIHPEFICDTCKEALFPHLIGI